MDDNEQIIVAYRKGIEMNFLPADDGDLMLYVCTKCGAQIAIDEKTDAGSRCPRCKGAIAPKERIIARWKRCGYFMPSNAAPPDESGEDETV